MDSWIIEQILKVTKSKKSIGFYKKAIKELGEGRVEMELGELKHQIRLGEVEDPARYFTTLLNKQINQKEEGKQAPEQGLATYKSSDQQQLFKELKFQDKTDSYSEITSIDNIAYQENMIKLPTILGSSFFTLSTNKSKSDEVPIKLVTHDGILNATLVRGRITRGAEETGILTAFDGRVFLAVIHIWQEKGCETSFVKLKTGNQLCGTIIFNVNQLIRKVYPNLKKPSRKDLLVFTNSIKRLCCASYCIYYSNGNTEIYHGFELLRGPSLTGIRRGRQTENTGIEVMISPEITRQYLKQRYLNRPEKLTKIKSEIGFLLWLYLEPRLESLAGAEYHAELQYLVKELRLPGAKWHKEKRKRKHHFSEAIRELKNKKTGTGKRIILRIDKGLFDYVLIAKLV